MKNNPNNIAQEVRLTEQIFWLTHLRWVAVCGVVFTVFIVSRFFHVQLPVWPLYGIAAFLAGYNAFFAWITAYFKKNQNYHAIYRTASIQIFLDLTCLVLLIHFSGGIDNPFYFYFIFHIIIAGILLSRRQTFILATYAIVLFVTTIFLECHGVLHHYRLEGIFPSSLSLYENLSYLFGVSLVFASTLYIAAFLTTSISRRLRDHEQSLREANVLLGEKDRIKSEYVLRVTHDIKEDLAAIHTCIEPIQKGLIGSLTDEQSNLLQRAMQRSKLLITYVDALLEMTKLKLTSQVEMLDFSFVELANTISASISSVASEKHIKLEVQVDSNIPSMKGVRVYMQEVLLNLLNNSLKYTPENGKIVWQNQRDGNMLRIKISDTGIGIPEEDKPRLFEEFFRARNARALLRKGTGLGLAITKKIVEMHHGKIWIESELGKGTCVHLEFPLPA